jgi:transposase InsO family protein
MEGHEVANSLGIREVLTAPQSPWQNAYVERLIGSIRRDCLDHVIVLNKQNLLDGFFRSTAMHDQVTPLAAVGFLQEWRLL